MILKNITWILLTEKTQSLLGDIIVNTLALWVDTSLGLAEVSNGIKRNRNDMKRHKHILSSGRFC